MIVMAGLDARLSGLARKVQVKTKPSSPGLSRRSTSAGCKNFAEQGYASVGGDLPLPRRGCAGQARA
jgi:hypothetical protein